MPTTERNEVDTPDAEKTSLVSQLARSLIRGAGSTKSRIDYQLPVDDEPELPDLPPLPEEETKEEKDARHSSFNMNFDNL